MSTTGRSRQPELFARSQAPTIRVADNHRLLVMTNEIDWTDLEELIQAIRMSKLKSEAGRPPHLRALAGALVLRATRKMTYRDTEDQIRYYAPARYLCGLTETQWSPDANTIQDFEQLLGEDGCAAGQRARGEVGRTGEAGGPEPDGSGHHGAGGGHPVSERGGSHGRFPDCGGGGERHGGQGAAGIPQGCEHSDPGRPRRRYALTGCSRRRPSRNRI